MKKFNNIDDLHSHLEKEAHKTIKHYYTDWKNYDRPEIMKHTGLKTREIYIILRECGSYLYTREDLLQCDFSATVMDYYTSDRTAKYYRVNFDALTVESIPAGLPRDIKREREEVKRAA